MPKTGPADRYEPLDLPAVRETASAWERFVTGRSIVGRPVPGQIADSWRRSLSSGVTPAGRCAPIAAAGDAFEQLREQHRELITAASTLLQTTAEVLREARSIMILTDAHGVVLECAGDMATLDAGQDIHLMDGGHWSESVIGTNGIGTAIATRAPAQVHAAEHFCAGIKAWTCAGAPIWSPANGSLLGVLDISGPPDTFQRNNLALAIAGARQIEASMTARSMLARSRLLDACLQRVGRLDASCVVVLDVQGLVVQLVGAAPAPGVRAGHPLPGLEARAPIDRWAERLPPPWRSDGFELVRLGHVVVGAMLVLPPHVRRAGARAFETSSEFDPRRSGFVEILGSSAALRATIERARQLTTKRVSVLIQGETGSGKELFARAIHGDETQGGPFVTFNCGAATKDLVAAELFGHVRGAYTGASPEGRAGRFELAHGGTLCLDEVGELPLELQPMLLRTLEEGVVFRLGDAHPRRVDVRLLSMTNRDLLSDIEAGRFRRDLYHRIGVARLRVPPLRERGGDVELLTEHFNRRLAARHGVTMRRFGPEVLRVFDAYEWPGNVRELRNVVEALLLTGEQADVSIDELPEEILDGVSLSLPEARSGRARAEASLEASERDAIERALRQHRGNLVHAARALGIARSTLYRKVERYQLERDTAAKSDI